MEKKKCLQINANVCDARQLTEETLRGFDTVRINCATLLAGQETRALLTRYGAKLNAGDVMELDGDVKLAEVNGKSVIKPGQPPQEKVILLVNGKLEVFPGSEEVVKSYAGIKVNGRVVCPEGMAGLFASAKINGRLETYPDGAIRLGETVQLDGTFHLRAREGALYYARACIVALDSGIDVDALVRKQVRFQSKRLLVSRALAERLVPLFDESCDITVLADGTAFVPSDATLDGSLLERYGARLYVNGDVTVKGDSAQALAKVEQLWAAGDLRVTPGMKGAVSGRDFRYRELEVVAGVELEDRAEVVVDAALLAMAGTEGLSVAGCDHVRMAPDLTAEQLEKTLLAVADCGWVCCTPAQNAILTRLCRDVGRLCPVDDPLTAAPWADGGEDEDEDEETVKINASWYVL